MKSKTIAILCATFVSLACVSNTPAAGNTPSENPDRAAKTSDELHWVRFTDPAEGAFSMDVPVGWQVQGGMYRFGYFDVRWMMDVRSLDSKIILRIMDVNVPPYTLPDQSTGPEGQEYSKPNQFQMMVSRYRDGQSYSELYARHRFSHICKTVTRRHRDWVPTMPPAWADDPGTKATEGGVAYDCDTSDGPRIVSVYARTALNNGLWFVTPISIMATADRTALAHSVVQHMIDSWEKNQRWAQYQNQMTQVGLDQVRRGFQQFMSEVQAYHNQRTAAMDQQVARFESRQNAQAEQVSRFGEILSGVQDVEDPMTGARFQVFSGPKANYYVNGNGVKVNSNISPGPDFHQLTPR